MRKYTPLHVHSYYSILDGLNSPAQLVQRAKEIDLDSIALTDHGTLRGLIDFYFECKKEDIKPIMGSEMYFVYDRLKREPVILESEHGHIKSKRYFHITVLVQNAKGWENIIALTTKSNKTGFYYKPRIDYDLIREHSEGIIFGSGCYGGAFSQNYLHIDEPGDNETFPISPKDRIDELFDFFTIGNEEHGKSNGGFYVELAAQHAIHDISGQKYLNYLLLNEAKERGIPFAIMSDAHWTSPEEYNEHDLLYTMNKKEYYYDNTRERFPSEETWIKSSEELMRYWDIHLKEFKHEGATYSISQEDFEQALDTTQDIADKCNVNIEDIYSDYMMPDLNIANPVSYLKERSLKNKSRLLNSLSDNKKTVYMDRLNHEIDLIVKQGFHGFFTMTADLCEYMKDNNILKGIGRGSSGGSLLAFMLGITEVDPIYHNLNFERFMNENKTSMPDIDIDIDDEKRQDILDYFVDKYGEDNITQIGTYTTMQKKLASKSVGKCLGIPYEHVNELSEFIGNFDFEEDKHMIEVGDKPESSVSIKNIEADFKHFEYLKEEFPLWYPMIQKIIGLPKNIGKHAAGIVVGNKPLIKLLSQQRTADDTFVSEWIDGAHRKELTEILKLVKFDLLGLSTLSILERTINLIKENKPENYNLLDLNLPNYEIINNIPLDDPKVFDYIFPLDSNAKTLGIFQFDTASMKSLLAKSKYEDPITKIEKTKPKIIPRNIIDLCALNSINRPPCLDENVHIEYAKRKDVNSFEVIHPLLREITEETLGLVIYQEQVMEIANKVGGISKSETDLFRKSLVKVTKADEADYENIKTEILGKFIDGAINNGLSKENAETLAFRLAKFSGYGFNKSHSRAYALIAYYSMYFKTYFNLEFLVSYLNKREKKLGDVVNEIGSKHFLQVHINHSGNDFEVQNDPDNNNERKIRVGLKEIKGIGKRAAEEIIEVRNQSIFTSLDDLQERTSKRVINVRRIEDLKNSGALIDLGIDTTYHKEKDSVGVPLVKDNSYMLKYFRACLNHSDITYNLKKVEEINNMKDSERDDYSSIELLCYVTHFETKPWSSKKNSYWNPKGFKGSLMDETGKIQMFKFETPVSKHEIRRRTHNNSKPFNELEEGQQEEIKSLIRKDYHNRIRANNIVVVKGRKSSYKGEAQIQIDEIRHDYNLSNYSQEGLVNFMNKWEPYIAQ